MSNDANKGYQFTVVNGAVTAVYEIKNGRAKFEKIDRDESWSVDGNNIVKTETEHGRIETTIFSDIDGDGIFAKMSKTYGAAAVTSNTAVNSSTHSTSGSDNDDLWRGNSNDDHYDGGQGNDQVSGGNGNDELRGASGNDRLSGDQGADDLFGGDGDDVLVGGAGSDDLYGGLGNDTFKYSNVLESGLTSSTHDHIHDFSAGDKIDLSGIDARSGNWSNDVFTYVGAASNVTSANANGALWFENGILYGSNDRDTAAEFQIELVGLIQLSMTDLVL
jgi:Ca2+-binding RTX toxin-like protein